ncbi:MAG: HEAT repeat domain-containing protein [Candidatus Methylomirabilia bacterium]
MPSVREEVRAALATLVNDQSEEVRRAAAEGLERLGSLEAIGQIKETLERAEKGQQLRAVYALGTLRDAQAMAAVVAALKSPEVDIRAAAIRAMASWDERAIDPLLEALKDPSLDVRILALDSLERFRDQRLVEVMLSLLEGQEDELRRRAIEVLGRLGSIRAKDLLLKLLQDPNPSIRAKAAGALAELELPR